MARATYRFHLRAERSDGEWAVMQEAAAVYDSPEEALAQAGVDLALGANVHPIDVIEGEHHGYEVTAFGQAVDPVHVRAATGFKPKTLADAAAIEKASEVMRELWMGRLGGSPSLMPDDDQVAPMADAKLKAASRRGSTRKDDDHAARVAETRERLAALL